MEYHGTCFPLSFESMDPTNCEEVISDFDSVFDYTVDPGHHSFQDRRP